MKVITLRLPVAAHSLLKEAARLDRKSLNTYPGDRLGVPVCGGSVAHCELWREVEADLDEEFKANTRLLEQQSGDIPHED